MSYHLLEGAEPHKETSTETMENLPYLYSFARYAKFN